MNQFLEMKKIRESNNLYHRYKYCLNYNNWSSVLTSIAIRLYRASKKYDNKIFFIIKSILNAKKILLAFSITHFFGQCISWKPWIRISGRSGYLIRAVYLPGGSGRLRSISISLLKKGAHNCQTGAKKNMTLTLLRGGGQVN